MTSTMGGKPWSECHCGIDSDGKPKRPMSILQRDFEVFAKQNNEDLAKDRNGKYINNYTSEAFKYFSHAYMLYHPGRWMSVKDNCLIASRCNWTYPMQTEDDAGEKSLVRSVAIGSMDGDICLPTNPEAWVDLAHLNIMIEQKDEE